jgi:2-keto-4-pentenoate hydratase/2-oxohepta-3-ene-1,7-dioic acid hydratase in catechol pathway
MRWANVWWNGAPRLAIEQEGQYRVLSEEVGPHRVTATDDLWALWDGGDPLPPHLAEAVAEARPVPAASVRLRPACVRPPRIFCIGRNYRAHVAETGAEVPEVPVVFNKFPETVLASGDEVPYPPASAQLDYEAELVAVIGRPAWEVPEERALEFVGGYTVGNDVSARDLQNRTSQWLLGKSLPGFAPLGPVLVTRDELHDPNGLAIQLDLNGERRQDSTTAAMIFGVPQLIAYLSHILPLKPGDILFTGTPDGVILGYPPERRRWLKPGDVMVARIERIGALQNRIGEGRAVYEEAQHGHA